MSRQARNQASEAFVFEGIHIAEAAVRMALKNKILVESIGEGRDFDPSSFLDEAREVMLALAKEATDGAARVAEQRKSAWGLHTKSRGTHDYRDRDTGNLRRRGREYKKVAKELERRAGDEGELLRLIEQSREAAWEDVAANIASTLKLVVQRPDLDEDYEQMRDARMQALRQVDLSDLAAQQKKRAKAVRKAARKAGV
ncbi:MAG TPA: asparagine synthase [Microbacteriaceae bacterium]|nr:asparagine synthase [Microbacteriaceae bacterium]